MAQFDELVLNNIDSLFRRYDLKVEESTQNYLKFKSDVIEVTIVHDEREDANLLFIGKTNDDNYLIDGNIIKEFFISDVEDCFKIPERTVKDFVDNLICLFEGHGKILLEGDEEIYKKINMYVSDKSETYTNQILREQALEVADKAWEKGNYKEFIEHMNKMELAKLPNSYKKKYEIAQKKS